MRVLAALSGGVDSAVAAALAKAAGHDVTAVHMALSANQTATRCGSRGCCTLEDAVDARQAASMLDIPFYVWDMAETFHETVVNDFLSEYRKGRTPNPCVRCNEFVKFRELLERGQAMGFDAVCTGHYARMLGEGENARLYRAKCLQKDQSYVLAVMGAQALQHVIFPLGDYQSKAQVRAEAQKMGLPMSDKPDSYDICFIADGDTQGFLRRSLGEDPGQIVDTEGRVLGEHSGAYQFTIGQRKGLNLTRPAADGKPRYVLRTEMDNNRVVVGASELLSVDRIEASETVFLSDPADRAFFGEQQVEIQYRAHGSVVPARIYYQGKGSLRVELERPTRAVAPGQSLVVYRGDEVLAEATIEKASRKSISV